MWYNDSDYLPPGCSPDDVDAAIGAFYADEHDERDERLAAPTKYGLCVPCAREGYAIPALGGLDHCEECVPACPPCRGYGTLDGRPEGTLLAGGTWAYRGAPLCPHCDGTGTAR